VIERAEQQHGIGARIGVGQATGVAQDGGHAGDLVRGRDVAGHRVDDPDVVAGLGQRGRVYTGGAADVEDPRRRRRQRAREDVPGTQEFEAA
jgi:hypothetical protein